MWLTGRHSSRRSSTGPHCVGAACAGPTTQGEGGLAEAADTG